MVILYLLMVTIILILILQERMLKKYKNLNNEEKSLVASLTHDLKNPTMAQINMLNLLLNGQFGELNPKQYEMVKLTCGSSKYVSNLVGTILTGYETDSKALILNKSEFIIEELIIKVCEENRYLAKDKGQQIEFHARQKVGYIYADKLQLERVISNLLSNAIKYGYKNSKIIITLKRINDEIKFSISNKSNPIPKNELKYVFKKFHKTKNSLLACSSNGLGLYVAKSIIDLHNGKIYAKSLSDGTCIFGFRLKVAKNSENVVKTS